MLKAFARIRGGRLSIAWSLLLPLLCVFPFVPCLANSTTLKLACGPCMLLLAKAKGASRGAD